VIRPCVECGEPSETEIPAGRVCRTHAIEFYTGLVAFAIDRTREIAEPAPWYALSTPPVLPGPRMTRAYVKRHPKWFTTTGPVAA
jgi:hypothetical protein